MPVFFILNKFKPLKKNIQPLTVAIKSFDKNTCEVYNLIATNLVGNE